MQKSCPAINVAQCSVVSIIQWYKSAACAVRLKCGRARLAIFRACLCYCKIAPWLFIRPTGRVFVEVNNAARQRKGRKANIRNVSSVMILLAGVKRESVSFSFSFLAWFQRYRRYFFQTKQNFGLVEEVHEQE